MPFRLAVLLLFFMALCISAYHRLRAARAGERFDRRQEGLLLAVVLRLAGIALAATTLAYLIEPGWVVPAALPLADWLRWCGLAPALGGLLLLYAALSHLGKNLTDTVAVRENATLVTSGPYRWLRHPFYTATALLVTGVTLLSASGLIAAWGGVVFTLLVIRTPLEEQQLIDRFGDDYRQYMAVTGRFLPRLGS